MRILVADDSPVIRTAVSVILEDAGYEVVTAADGIETIQKFYEEQPDLVVLDIQMPNMTGYMACRLLKEDWSVAHIPILILTAHDSAEDRYWADKSGADGYLTKEALGDALLVGHSQCLGREGTVRYRRSARTRVRSARSSRRAGAGHPDARPETLRDDHRQRHRDDGDPGDGSARGAHRDHVHSRVDSSPTTRPPSRSSMQKVVGGRLDRVVDKRDLDAFIALAGEEMIQRSAAGYGFSEMTPWRCDTLNLEEAAGLPDGWRSMFSIDLRVRGERSGDARSGRSSSRGFLAAGRPHASYGRASDCDGHQLCDSLSACDRGRSPAKPVEPLRVERVRSRVWLGLTGRAVTQATTETTGGRMNAISITLAVLLAVVTIVAVTAVIGLDSGSEQPSPPPSVRLG